MKILLFGGNWHEIWRDLALRKIFYDVMVMMLKFCATLKKMPQI
jgi:hypothetical protein